MKKRLISLTMAALLLLLTACGEQSGQEDKKDGVSDEIGTETDIITELGLNAESKGL